MSGIYPSAVDTPMLRHAAGLFEWMGQRGFKKYLATTAAAPS